MTRPRPGAGSGISDDFELSEVDQHILELNHVGCSMKEISVLLREKYNIQLGKSSVTRHLRELRQNPDNDVQINNECTIPQQPREESRWYKIIQRLKEAIDEYTRLHGFKPSSRTMYYQLLDEHILTGSSSDQKQFKEKTVTARLGWKDAEDNLYYPKLEIDCFADDDTRIVSNNYEDFHPMLPIPPGGIEDPDAYIDYEIQRLKEAPERYYGHGSFGRPGNRGGYWYDQPEYVEVWQEKNDLMPGFEKLLQDKHIVIRSNKGYPSLEFLHRCTAELKRLIDDHDFEPENIHIKYCGDWDPSGENIDYYIKKRLRELGISGIDFQRIAVTPEQIEEYELPLMSIEQRADKKVPNPNMKEFVRRHGSKATHLNAFFRETYR